jgi:hypothetical protein
VPLELTYGDRKRVKKSTGTLYWTGMGNDTLAESDLTATMQKESEYLQVHRQRTRCRKRAG